MAKKRVSIKDIAEIAGVSHPTVSRALRGQGRMSESTRTRIVAIAQDLGYTPSLMARGLVLQRSYCVGLIVPAFSDPFHSEVAQGVEQEAQQHDYSIFLASTEENTERELEVARSFLGRQVDGIIISSSLVGNKYMDFLQETGIPIVIINTMAQSDKIHTIDHDDYDGGRKLVAHLIEQGYRRIAYLGNARAGRANTDRHRAWRDTLNDSGLKPELMVNGPTNRIDGGVTGAKRLLERAEDLWRSSPDAIFCYNDTMAIGALSVLRKQGIRVPHDVAVAGFDDLDIAAVVDPPLTTIHQPRHKMGVAAMQTLLELMNRKNSSPQAEIELATFMVGTLVVREST